LHLKDSKDIKLTTHQNSSAVKERLITFQKFNQMSQSGRNQQFTQSAA